MPCCSRRLSSALTRAAPRSALPPLAQGNVGIAFDLMTVNLADLPRLPSVVPALKLLFAEEEQKEDEEAQPQMLT